MSASTLASAQTQFYDWQTYRCAYEVRSASGETQSPPLLLIHPIGVGLSRRFWDRFAAAWVASGQQQPLYIPDLLGCGESEMPRIAYSPDDWAAHLQTFLQTVVQQPAIVIAQGALFPVAIELANRQPDLLRGMILAGPPAWSIMTGQTPDWQNRLLWNLFDSPLGKSFYRYARRRQFLQSFSVKQLFAESEAVDAEWLNTLEAGAADPESRHAVFSFLAGFWRRNYETAIEQLNLPTLVVFGDEASSISRSGQGESSDQRMTDYLKHLPQAQGIQLPGRNVLPYESTAQFVEAIVPFVQQLTG